MVGGFIKKAYSWLVQRPERLGSLLLVGTLPHAFDNVYRNSFDEYDLAAVMCSFPIGYIAGFLLRTFAYNDKLHPRTRLSDFSKRRAIRNNIKKSDFESLVEKNYKLPRASSIKALFSQARPPIEPHLEKSVDKLAFIAEFTGDIALHENAAEIYFAQDRFDDGLMQFNKILKLQKEKNQSIPLVFEPDWYFSLFVDKVLASVQPRDPVPLFHTSLMHLLKHDFSNALFYSSFAKKTAEEFYSPMKKEFLCLDAMLHNVLDSKNKNIIWQDFIKEIKKEPALDRIAETKNPVRILKSSRFLANTIVFKDKKNKEDLVAESVLTSRIKSIISAKYDVAEPLYITHEPIDSMHTYVMRHVQGDSLLERFRHKDYSALDSIVDCLALIHANIKESEVRKGRLQIARKLRKKLLDKDLGLPREVAKRIIENYRPVYDSFKNSIYVYNKDAHPENWLINSKIIVLDCENEFLVPMQFDLVNLLEYSDYLTDKQKDKAIEKYVTSFNSCSAQYIDLIEFRRVYFNAVINRAISLCTAWSSKDRKSMHPERIKVISNAIHAINRLEKEYNDFYSINSCNYDALRDSLKEIRNLVSVNGNH